jgi:transmembrane sensor
MKRNDFKKFIPKYLLKRKYDRDEELIAHYFEAIQKQEQPEEVVAVEDEFDSQGVYDRIMERTQAKYKHRRFTKNIWFAAASVTLFFVLSVFVYRHQPAVLEFIDPVVLRERVAARGQMKQFTLTDGTRVWLNADSKLSYPEKFRGGTRDVTLSGEAYFEVKHDERKPFIIHTLHTTTQVLGTTFNVSAYQENKNIEITVVTGKVGVRASGSSERENVLFVTPNQQAVYDKARNTLHRNLVGNALETIAWKEGKLNYRSTLLPEIIAELQRKYNVDIHTGKNLNTCTLSVDFNDEPLNKVLNILAELVQGKVDYKDGYYILKGKGCG